MLVLTGMNFEEQDKLYDQAKTSLKKFMSEQTSRIETAIKLDPAFLAEHEEALWAAGYVKSARNQQKYKNDGSSRKERDAELWRSNEKLDSYDESSSLQRSWTRSDQRVNPTGHDGRPLLCRACGSYRHLVAECPDSWENQSPENVLQTEQGEDIVCRTGEQQGESETFLSFSDNIANLRQETKNAVVLDSGCFSTVCGKLWIEQYLSSLSSYDQTKIIRMEGQKVFPFGGGEQLKSIGCYIISIVLAGRKLWLKTDVVESDVPLLLSRISMKRAKLQLNTEHDVAHFLGRTVKLRCTSSGHYCIPITDEKNNGMWSQKSTRDNVTAKAGLKWSEYNFTQSSRMNRNHGPGMKEHMVWRRPRNNCTGIK